MVKEELNSDRVNYLIWRYLQESNYCQTALTLQRDWHREDPRKDIDPADHVKHHALVTILRKGLLYDDLQRSLRQGRRVDAPASHGVFGPLLSPPTPPAQSHEEFENVRKRSVEQREFELRNVSPSKRPRLINGFENGFDVTPMDVDESHVNGNSNGNGSNSNSNGIGIGNGHAYPSPKEVEQPLPPIITNGPEVAAQTEKVAELTSNTTFLTLSDSSTPDPPLILHCDWNPHTESLLAAAGTDSLVRLWKISSRAIASSDTLVNINGATPLFQDVRDADARPNTSVTAFSWSLDGQMFAVATEAEVDDLARVSIWTAEGSHLHTYTGFEPPIISLAWNPTGEQVLAVGPENNGIAVMVFSIAQQTSISYSLPRHALQNFPLEIEWTGDSDFMVCGGDILRSLHFNAQDSKIELTKKYELREDDTLTGIAYDRHTGMLATATEAGDIDVWDSQGEKMHTISAHSGGIITLAWQPLNNVSVINPSSERLLVSSGEDGFIRIWNARTESKVLQTMTMESSVVALAFTPDGAFIAGATNRQILIWKMEDVRVPKAHWSRGSEVGWDSPMNGSASEEDHHILCWDADGQKLAYAVNSQVWRSYPRTCVEVADSH